MTSTVLSAPSSTSATPTRTALAALVALALLLTIFIGIIASVGHGGSWVRAAVLLAKTLTLAQWLFLASWAALTGLLFAFGAGPRPARPLMRLLALISGTLVPVGLFLLGGLMGHLWPELRDTDGPFDRPLLSLPLLVYGLAAPWLLGRLARRLRPAEVTAR